MSSALQQERPERGNAVDFIGSVSAALSVAVALILDQALGWGEGRWSVLVPDVVLVMFPALAVWIVVAVMERARGARSILLLVTHCVSVFVPPIALAMLAHQGHILSPWAGEHLEAMTALSARGLETGIVVLAVMMAVAACLHAVRTWTYSRQRR
jgi:hypothetical protein